jgi:hypothetical protein
MTLQQFSTILDNYIGGETAQTMKMYAVDFRNEYLHIFRIDSSNWHGGSAVQGGKQWGIIFEYTTGKQITSLATWKNLSVKYDIKITPRRGYPGHYAIRFYGMSRCPDQKVINAFIRYLFCLE